MCDSVCVKILLHTDIPARKAALGRNCFSRRNNFGLHGSPPSGSRSVRLTAISSSVFSGWNQNNCSSMFSWYSSSNITCCWVVFSPSSFSIIYCFLVTQSNHNKPQMFQPMGCSDLLVFVIEPGVSLLLNFMLASVSTEANRSTWNVKHVDPETAPSLKIMNSYQCTNSSGLYATNTEISDQINTDVLFRRVNYL